MYNTQKGDAIQNIFVDNTSTAPPPLNRGVTPNTALLAAARQSYKQSQLTARARAACCGLLARDTRDITRSRGHVSRSSSDSPMVRPQPCPQLRTHTGPSQSEL